MNTVNGIGTPPDQIVADQWGNSLWFRILLITAFGLGIFFRLAGLGNKMYSHDEALASLYATGYTVNEVVTNVWDGKDTSLKDIQKYIKPSEDKDSSDTLSFLALNSPHQAPLFYMLAHHWMRLVGYTPAAMRGLASVFGLLSIPAFYWFSEELFCSSLIALLSTAFFALSPFHILFAQDARPYSLWTLATLLSSAALLQAMRKNNTMTWLIYSGCLILGMYSHQLFGLVILVHACFFTGIYFIHHKGGYTSFLSACLIAFLAYTPWLSFIITRWRLVEAQVDILEMQTSWPRSIQLWTLNFSSPLIDLDFSAGNQIPYLLRGLMLIFMATALLFFVRHGSQQQKIFILLIYTITAGALFVPDLLFGGTRSITGRYFVPSSIATILVIAFFLTTKLDQAGATTKLQWKLLVSLLMTVSTLSDVNSLLTESWWNKELGRIRLEFIQEIDKDRTLLIVNNIYPTNLGDVLSLSHEIDSDVHFRLYSDSSKMEFGGNYQYIYWFASSPQTVQKTSESEGFRIREVVKSILWQIESKQE